MSAKLSASFYNPALAGTLNAAIETSKTNSQNELQVSVFVYRAGVSAH